MQVKTVILLFCGLLASTAALAPSGGPISHDDQVKFPPQPANLSTLIPPHSSTSTSSTNPTPITSSTSTTSKPTTAPPNITTTAKPTTPHPQPTPNITTTAKPTTPHPPPTPNTTTTDKPTTTPSPPNTTTTTKPTSTTVAPKPDPNKKPEVNTFSGNYTGTKFVCIYAQMAIQVEIFEQGKNTSSWNVPKEPQYNSSCSSNTTGMLEIKWNKNDSIVFGFFRNSSEGKYEIESVNASIVLNGNATTQFHHNHSEFSVFSKLSYYCAKDQPLNLTSSQVNGTLIKVHVSQLHYQAFMNDTKPHFASVWDCDGVNVSDVVPIVVGVVLAILVVLILVGYLYGRRRWQARGYLSM